MLVRSIVAFFLASAMLAYGDDPPQSNAVKAAIKEYESEPEQAG